MAGCAVTKRLVLLAIHCSSARLPTTLHRADRLAPFPTFSFTSTKPTQPSLRTSAFPIKVQLIYPIHQRGKRIAASASHLILGAVLTMIGQQPKTKSAHRQSRLLTHHASLLSILHFHSSFVAVLSNVQSVALLSKQLYDATRAEQRHLPTSSSHCGGMRVADERTNSVSSHSLPPISVSPLYSTTTPNTFAQLLRVTSRIARSTISAAHPK
ncbi:hypothetical protein BLNAU_17154 [Blattamonas nauphoetae]|uniref:Secreted protein n=1 Tax=Blattamonas nauphoetae TaxID=2049346 RepID=A0ABQ9X9K7_9EUKA|nr:hypothetical protein BLNAU_17154 [Blattamonas nauphoetae]